MIYRDRLGRSLRHAAPPTLCSATCEKAGLVRLRRLRLWTMTVGRTWLPVTPENGRLAVFANDRQAGAFSRKPATARALKVPLVFARSLDNRGLTRSRWPVTPCYSKRQAPRPVRGGHLSGSDRELGEVRRRSPPRTSTADGRVEPDPPSTGQWRSAGRPLRQPDRKLQPLASPCRSKASRTLELAPGAEVEVKLRRPPTRRRSTDGTPLHLRPRRPERRGRRGARSPGPTA